MTLHAIGELLGAGALVLGIGAVLARFERRSLDGMTLRGVCYAVDA